MVQVAALQRIYVDSLRAACVTEVLGKPSSVGAPRNEPENERTVGLPQGSCALTRWVIRGEKMGGHHLKLLESLEDLREKERSEALEDVGSVAILSS